MVNPMQKNKLNKRLPLNVDGRLIAAIDEHRAGLESQGLRVSRSSAAVSLIHSALAANKAQSPSPAS